MAVVLSKRVESLSVEVRLKNDATLDETKDAVLEEGLARVVRKAITTHMESYAETPDIESIKIAYTSEDN